MRSLRSFGRRWVIAAVATSALVALALGVVLLHPFSPAEPAEPAVAGVQVGAACGLSNAAFCENFSTPNAGGARSGDLDPSRWSVSRLTNVANWTQGQLNEFFPTSLPVCDQNVGSAVPNNDFRICRPGGGEAPYFDELFNDAGNFVFNDSRIRQPFDFANRTGTIAFDVDAKTAGSHTWWVEVWITDQPSPAPSGETIGVAPFPRNGVGIMFSGCGQPPALGGNDNIGGPEIVWTSNNYNIGQSQISSGGCYGTADGVKNHIELHVSQQRIEVWASEPGGSNFRMVGFKDNLNLPFTRGYVNFEHVHYNANKEQVSAQQHYEWGNLAFDGPVLPTPRGYDVPDALQPSRDSGAVNLGYNLINGSMQSGRTFAPFVLHNVDLTSATGAELNLNVQSYNSGTQLQYRFNGGTWRNLTYPFPNSSNSWRAMSASIGLGDLHAGDNTLEFTSPNAILQITNIDLTVETSSLTGPPPAPTATNTAVPTNTTVPTNTAVVANTAIPTNTAVVVGNTAIPTNTAVVVNTTTPTAPPTPTSTVVIPPTVGPAKSSPPTFVQINSTTPQSPQSTVNVRFGQGQAAGDTNIVVVGWNDATSNIVSVSDSAGNVYRVAAPTARGQRLSQAIYYASSIKAAAAGTNTITVTFNAAAGYPDIRILEYGGLDAANPFHVSASGAGNSQMSSSGGIATTLANELIVGAGTTNGAFSGREAAFKTRVITNPDADIVQDQTVTTAGESYTASAPVNDVWVMQVAAFRAATH